ncbi:MULTISPECIES: cytoplasmic protein [Paenibacillus]|uniref:Polymer-forming cytoskeletal protein n=1 Tax=Paenibacillus albilobatus TaxID=2716884 RepID=A0A919XI69_9BACL|nr:MULTISPECIES: cytoplasmic protein [Paenibacillus]GIO33332.1 hypothetical protein J2TS6_44730 [Paenibacillus albilobatus]
MAMNGNPNGTRGDLKITGNAQSGGGFFRNVKITGDAVINNDTECEMFKCLGGSEVKGSLRAGSVSCNGTLKVAGSVSGGSVRTQGDLRIGGDLAVQSVSISGELTVGGRVSAEKAKITGELRASSDCQMEELSVRGMVDVNGMLNAEQADFKLHGHSRLRELVGSQITVKRGSGMSLLGSLFMGSDGVLTAETIEGDTVMLENTKAAVVRGRSVTIGAGCRIGLVEYKDDLKKDNEAVVSQSVKIG